jgi:quercetin dioxygenase-like cupin family protein
MINWIEKWEGTPYPDFLRDLPEIDVPFDGIRGWLIQSNSMQVVFLDIDPVGEVPPHSHCAQWGLIVEGEMKLTIGGDTKLYKKGDWYFIPEGVIHSASFHSRVYAIDVFNEPQRYSAK